ncbi:MAG TPA: hypothetical protein VFU81_10260 [Thermomicrobiales bacterium]|nr:hypothetical protein [Thermomicrobiales bacterium]
MADPIQQLFDAIVARLAIPDEQKDVDLNASAADDEAADKAAVAQAELNRAATLAGPFRDGLLLAHAAATRGEPTISLDDRQPEQNAMADALIQMLVSYDLAEATTTETEPLHYIYAVTVNWPKLTAVAADAGVDLDAALATR